MDMKITLVGMDGVQREMRRIADELKRGKAMAMAINKTSEKAQVEIRRAVTERFAIDAASIRQSMTLRRATNRGNVAEAQITLFGSPTKKGRSMNMVRFLAAVQYAQQAMKTRGSKATKSQLKALGDQLGFLIRRGGGLKTIPGSFVGNRGRTVFERIPGTTMGPRSKYAGTQHAEKIKPVQVIGVAQMFSTRVIQQRVMAKISADLEIEARRAVDGILSGAIR